MRRGCLFGVAGLLVICLLLCGVAYFVGLPRFQDSVSDTVDDAMSTVVAQQIPVSDGSAQPGTYALTEQEIQDSLSANLDSSTTQDIVIRITPSGITFGLTSEGGQETTYSGVPIAANGRLEMTKMDTTDGFLDFFYPAEKLGNAVERSVNDYLTENKLTLDDVTLEDGQVSLITSAAS